MTSRGEKDFARFPRFAAWLYDWLLRTTPAETQTVEIARDLASRVDGGRLLDIGTGPGWLLLEVHKLNPRFELYGLDVSAEMVQRAKNNLKGVNVELRHGSIRSTGYKNDFFDLITSTGSFYLWDQPMECVDEIHRILKVGRSACLFESYRDHDTQEFRRALVANLAKVDSIRRPLCRFALKKQLRMTYRTEEFARILDRSKFANNYALTKVKLAGLPIWLRITLNKVSTPS